MPTKREPDCPAVIESNAWMLIGDVETMLRAVRGRDDLKEERAPLLSSMMAMRRSLGQPYTGEELRQIMGEDYA